MLSEQCLRCTKLHFQFSGCKRQKMKHLLLHSVFLENVVNLRCYPWPLCGKHSCAFRRYIVCHLSWHASAWHWCELWWTLHSKVSKDSERCHFRLFVCKCLFVKWIYVMFYVHFLCCTITFLSQNFRQAVSRELVSVLFMVSVIYVRSKSGCASPTVAKWKQIS